VKAKVLATALAVVAILATGCAGQVNQEVCDDVALLERQLDSVESEISPQIEQEVRDDYAEIATEANCPGYNNPDN
jgi:hypothetical protein